MSNKKDFVTELCISGLKNGVPSISEECPPAKIFFQQTVVEYVREILTSIRVSVKEKECYKNVRRFYSLFLKTAKSNCEVCDMRDFEDFDVAFANYVDALTEACYLRGVRDTARILDNYKYLAQENELTDSQSMRLTEQSCKHSVHNSIMES